MDRAHSVVHYLNQFFAGVGGEEAAGHVLEVREGPVGPGVLIQRPGGESLRVHSTLVCGDNRFLEHEAESIQQGLDEVARIGPEIFVAGPAFASGRYGLACIKMCRAVAERFGIPCLTALHPENPAVGLHMHLPHVYVTPTGESASSMADAMDRMACLALKIVTQGEEGLFAESDGYLLRSVRRNVRLKAGGPARAVGMLLQKLAGQPHATELPVEVRETVPAATPVRDLRKARIALVTESGIVPVGNPDRLPAARATSWFKYSIKDVDGLEGGTYQSVHGGYDSSWVDLDPDRAVSLDALRHFERTGEIGAVSGRMFVTCGSVGNVEVMKRIGREMADELIKTGVHGVILSAT